MKLFDKSKIDFRLYRDSCVYKGGHYIKDLRIIKNRDLRKIVVVDNSIVSFMRNLNNGVHVSSYFGQDNDRALLGLISFLKTLKDCENIQEELAKKLKIQEAYENYEE